MRALTPWLIIALLIAGGTITWLKKQNKELKDTIVIMKHEAEEASASFASVNWFNATTITVMKNQWAEKDKRLQTKLDSLVKVNHLKALVSATVIDTEYKDTNRVQAVTEAPILKDANIYIVPVSYDNGCWGMKGEILTSDKGARLDITERKAVNSIQMVVVKERKFLFWTTRKAQYQIYSDCGDPIVTEIKYVK